MKYIALSILSPKFRANYWVEKRHFSWKTSQFPPLETSGSKIPNWHSGMKSTSTISTSIINFGLRGASPWIDFHGVRAWWYARKVKLVLKFKRIFFWKSPRVYMILFSECFRGLIPSQVNLIPNGTNRDPKMDKFVMKASETWINTVR